jgi:signal transduction histidine kinase
VRGFQFGQPDLSVHVTEGRMNALTQFGIPPEAAGEHKRSSAEVPSEPVFVSQSGSQSEAQSMEAVGRLVAGVAHDFNNLLTGIMLCSDLLLAGLNQRNWLRRYAVEIRSACVNGASLVQQLSVAAGPGTTEAASLSFNDAVGRNARPSRPAYRRKHSS